MLILVHAVGLNLYPAMIQRFHVVPNEVDAEKPFIERNIKFTRLAYGLDKTEKEMKILVFSFGGGTHDATIMEFGKGVFQVLATSGDTQTGGTDIDKAVIQVLLDDFRSKTGIDLSTDRTAMARLKEAAEQAKIQLSNLTSTDIDLPFIASDSSGPKNLHYTLTRTKLEEVARPIVSKTENTIRKVMSDAKLSPEQVDKVILIGGMTRMPLVRKFVEDVAGKGLLHDLDVQPGPRRRRVQLA